MWNQISWLLKSPANLDLHCLKSTKFGIIISYGYSVLIKSNMVNPKIDFRILILVILFMTIGLVII